MKFDSNLSLYIESLVLHSSPITTTMASLSQPSLTTATKTHIPPSSLSPFFPKKTQLSKLAKHNHHLAPRVVSCKAQNDDQNGQEQQSPLENFDRRDVLIGLGGL